MDGLSCGVGSTSQGIVNVAWMTTASGAIASKNAFSSSPGLASGRGVSARVGNEQSLGVYSIPVGSAFLLTLDHKAPPPFGIDRGPSTSQ
jgi:hypothetical protein